MPRWIKLKNDIWVSFGGRKQRVSELSPELRKKLGIEELPDEEKVKSKSQEIRASKVRDYEVVRERVPVGRKLSERTDDGFDLIMKGVEAGLRGIGKWLNKRS